MFHVDDGLLFCSIDPYHSMSKQKILPIEPLIQCEAGRAKTMQRQSLYSPQTPKWPPSDKGEFVQGSGSSTTVCGGQAT